MLLRPRRPQEAQCRGTCRRSKRRGQLDSVLRSTRLGHRQATRPPVEAVRESRGCGVRVGAAPVTEGDGWLGWVGCLVCSPPMFVLLCFSTFRHSRCELHPRVGVSVDASVDLPLEKLRGVTDVLKRSCGNHHLFACTQRRGKLNGGPAGRGVGGE